MSYAREPVLQPVPIESLHPTQITVGMREVEERRKRLRKQKPQKIGSFIGRHMIPVVLGPKKRHYVIDHHHLSLALHKEGLRDVLVTVVLDLSALNLDAFWTVLDHKSLVYPFDAQGRRRDFADIPKTVMQLKDDPFRSLAGELRRAGGFAKDTTPFSEFLWADFFRRKIKRKAVEADFAAAVEQALRDDPELRAMRNERQGTRVLNRFERSRRKRPKARRHRLVACSASMTEIAVLAASWP